MEARKNYLDNIRWITIILVVIFHIYFYYNNIGIDAMFAGVSPFEGQITFAGLFQYIVYPWFMVLLFIIAGMSARYALKKRTTKEFLKSRVDKLLAPSTLGVLAFGWIGGYIIYIHIASRSMPADTPGFVGVIITICSGIGALWFCHVLFVATLFLLLVRKIITKCHGSDDSVCNWFEKITESRLGFSILLIIMYFILWGGSHILNMPLITSYRNGIYIPAFLFGYYIFSNDIMIGRLKKLVLPFFLLTIISGVFYIMRCYGLEYGAVKTLSRWDVNLYAFLMILLVLGAGAGYLENRNGFTDYMKQRCFGIYVLHIPVLLVTNYLLAGTALPMTVIYLIELVSAIVFSILHYEILHRIPILRYWIFGMRKSSGRGKE